MAARPYPVLTVARLALRDGGPQPYCLHCGAEVGIGVQHRAAKGMGGDEWAERPSNGVILCNLLNGDAEADPVAAELCVRYGWKIGRWDNPATIPVYDAITGAWWLLDDLGGRRRVA